MKFLLFLTISLVVPGLLQGCSNSKAAAPAPESPDSDSTIDIDNDGTDSEVESCVTCGSGKTNPCKRQVPCIILNQFQRFSFQRVLSEQSVQLLFEQYHRQKEGMLKTENKYENYKISSINKPAYFVS